MWHGHLKIILVTALLGISGCGILFDILQPNTTTVRLINDSNSFPVEAQLLYDDEQDIPEFLLEEEGTELNFTISPGEVTSFSRDCDDLQAVMIERAELSIVGDIGPSTSSNVLRDGDEFSCGDTITFTFSHSQILVDFDVSTSVQR